MCRERETSCGSGRKSLKSRKELCNRCGFEETLRHRIRLLFGTGEFGVTRGMLGSEGQPPVPADADDGNDLGQFRNAANQAPTGDCPDLSLGNLRRLGVAPGGNDPTPVAAANDGCRLFGADGRQAKDSPPKGFGQRTGGLDRPASNRRTRIERRSGASTLQPPIERPPRRTRVGPGSDLGPHLRPASATRPIATNRDLRTTPASVPIRGRRICA